MSAAYRLMRGKPDYSKPADIALRDIAQKGGLSLSRDTFARSGADLAKQVVSAGSSTGSFGLLKSAKNIIEHYNNVFDMVSPLASYMALSQAGVANVDAAAGALDLMNFRKGGSHMQLFTSTIAFAQPAVTGGANMLAMLRTTKGKAILGTALLGFAAMQMLSAAGADDDEGGNLINQLPEYTRNNNINFQAGGYTFSIPVGFGATRLANTAARISIDHVTKNQKVVDSLWDLFTSGLVPSVSPVEDVKIKDPLKKVLYMGSPTVLRPMLSVAMNANPIGGEIDHEKWIDPKQYRHMQGSKTIAPEYKSMARTLYEMSGGYYDFTPDATKALVNGYALGPFRTAVTELITNPDREAKGKETGIPVISALVSSKIKPINEDAWKGQVREAQAEMEDLHKEKAKLSLDTSADGRAALRELMAKPEYKLSMIYDEIDKRMRNEAAQVTRSLTTKQITATAAQDRKDAIKERRSDEEAKFLVKWRAMRGMS
jgi:hypothetical protein